MRKMMALCSVAVVAFGGVLAAKADTCSSTPSNLVSNCGFETGDFTGWSGTSTSDTTGNFNGVAPGDSYQGTYAAYLGAASPEYTGPTTLTQTLATVAGAQYTISFALDNEFSGSTSYTDSFSADFGSSVLFTETNAPASAYQLYTFTTVASGASTTLTFNSFNDSSYFDLDDVSVIGPAGTAPTVTPEPSSLVLLGTGLMGAVGVARRRLRA